MNQIDDKHVEYSNLLERFETLRIKSEEDDSDEKLNDIDQLRRDVCGCNTSNENKTEMTQKIYNDLNTHSITNEQIAQISKLIAELAKTDECRKALVEQNLFEPLNKCLAKSDLNDKSKIQIFRAIGNMCYYNDAGRSAYLKADGFTYLFESCKYCSNFDLGSCSTSEEQATKIMLITVILGCLHNVSNENESMRKAIYEMNVMAILKPFIPFLKTSKGILVNFFSCLENLLDLMPGKDLFKQEKIALALYQNLDSHLILDLDDYAEDFFNLLSFVNDIELSKQYLFETEFIVEVISAMETNASDEEFTRHSGLFLVSLLVKDDKIDEIFDYKNNLLLTKAIEWLESFKTENLFVSAAVIIANYLRSDENVQKLMQDSRQPNVKIIEILKAFQKLNVSEEKTSPKQINKIHSFLGCLRNFCVAVNMRNDLLKCNLIETVLPFCSHENMEIKSKSLGIIRLMVKSCTSNNGLDLIFDSLEMFANIVINPGDHPIIVGESSRLACYLPIAAKSEINIEKFCQHKFVPVICNQLNTEHLIMLNEALLALSVLVTVNYRATYPQLKESSLKENLKSLFLKEKIPLEMRLNALKLFTIIYEKHDFYTQSDLKEYLGALNKLRLLADSDFLKKHVTQLIDLIEVDTVVE